MRNKMYFKDASTIAILCARQDGTETEVLIDFADLEKVSKIPGSWGVGNTNGSTTYCSTLLGNPATGQRRVYMHRMICGFPDGKVCDHRSGIGTDNRRRNLRVVSQQENVAKMRLSDKPRKNNKFGIRGISQTKSGFYRVRFGGRSMGLFDELEDARLYWKMLRAFTNWKRTGRP